MILGIDTSCYTTSVAAAEKGEILLDLRSPLCVKEGERGLRQSDGVFMHVRNLPSLIESAAKEIDFSQITAVAVSKTPRPCEDSYMPVFASGHSFARALASALRVPLFETSHQEGHIMAALHSCGNAVTENEFVSVHISGGTTELLRTKRKPCGFSLELAAGSLDLHAGQLVDRCGVMLGMKFPCGAQLDALAQTAEKGAKLPVTLKGADFHLSGAETQAAKLISGGAEPCEIALGVLECIADSLKKSLDVLYERQPFSTVIMGGGVSASRVIRGRLKSEKYRILFAGQKYSTDNACGVALIGELAENE